MSSEQQQQTTEQRWAAQATGMLAGRTIVEVRYQTPEESGEEFWDRRAPVLVLDDGTLLYPSRDDEGNDAGALFGLLSTGERLGVPVMR